MQESAETPKNDVPAKDAPEKSVPADSANSVPAKSENSEHSEISENSEKSVPANSVPAKNPLIPIGIDLDCYTAAWLRFPLIVMVVFIHVTLFYWFSDDYVSWFRRVIHWLFDIQQFPVSLAIIQLIQDVVTRVAVPLFFFIAGYFYFFKVEKFDFQTWLAKSRKRFFTLAVPYLVWNLLAAGQVFVRWYSNDCGDSLTDFLSWTTEFRGGNASYFMGEEHPIFGLFFLITSGTLTVGELFPRPLVGQFWFVRDLFIISLALTPVFWFVLRRKFLNFAFIAACLVLWFAFGNDIHVNAQFMTPGILFFASGALFSINKWSVSRLCVPARWGALVAYLIIAFLDWRWNVFGFNYVFGDNRACIHGIGIFLGAVALWGWVSTGIRAHLLVPHKFLSGASFFIFCSHAVTCRVFEATILRLLPRSSEFEVMLGFLFFAVFALAFSVSLFWILRKFAPIALVPLAGGRK